MLTFFQRVFVQKWAFFDLSFFFSRQYRPKNVFYDILGRKNAFLSYKNKTFKKSKIWNFSKGVNPWFCSKNGHFSNCFFLANIGQQNLFYAILERKNPFLSYKNKKFNKSKHWDFSKGLTHGFGPKMAMFWTFFS